MSDSSDDSVVSIIAVHDPQCLDTAYSVLAVSAAKIINRQLCENSSFITSSHDQPSVSSHNSQTPLQYPVKLKVTTACSATDIQNIETGFKKAYSDGAHTLTKDISKSNKKSRRKRRSKLSVVSVKEEIIPEEAPRTKEYPVTYGSDHSNNEVKSTETETRAQSSDVTRKHNKEISNGSIGTSNDNLKYTTTSNVNEVKESSSVEAGEMGNGLSSEKQKCAKVLLGRRKDNDSKNSRATKSKSPPSDLEDINRSSIETTDSYSSAATLIATANAAVGRRSPKKSPRSIPRWGVKLRDGVSSDDESFVSAGFRTPKSTTPLLKRAVEQPSPSQRLMEFGKHIESGITEKFANISPNAEPSSDPSKKKNKTNVEIQQHRKTTGESIGISLPEKIFSSLPKRCSKDATIETDSDSFAMFQNTELLYASIPKDFHLIDDNLSDDVFMSCIDLASNSPGIPARSQYKNSNAQHCSAKGVNQAKTSKKPTQQSVTEIDTVQEESVTSPHLLSDHGCSKATGNKQAREEFATSYAIASSDTVTKSSRSLRSLKMSEFSKLVSIPRQATENLYISKSQNRSKNKLGITVNNENDKPKHSRGEQTAPKTNYMCPNPSCRSKSPESSNSSLNMFHPTPCADQRSPSSQVKHQQKRSLTHLTQNNQPRKDSILSNIKFQKSSQTDSPGLPKEGICNPSEGLKSTKKPSSPSIQMSRKERSPNSPNHSPGSPVVPRHGIKDGPLSPGIAKQIGSEASPLLIQQREPHGGTLYCTIKKPEQLTSVTVQAQTSSSNDLETNNSACATAEEESSQIQDSPKASKQDKIAMNIIKKKEHLRSTYDNVPDSDDSMAYFTGKNDPIFFEDNCVSEEIIATEQTPLHYKVEQPQKLGIEILKSPSQAKIECVLLKRKKTDSCVADILMSGKESSKPELGKSLLMTFPNEPYQTNLHESEPMETKLDNGEETKINKQQMSQLNKETSNTSKPKPDDTKPIEHLAKRQIRRRNKKKCLEMESKGSINSSSDVPLSPNLLEEYTTFTSSTTPIIEEAQLDINKIEEIHKNEPTVKLGADPEFTTNILIQDKAVNAISENYKSTSAKNESSMDRRNVIDSVVLSDPLLPINLEKRDHVSPPNHSANNNLMGIAEEFDDRDDVDNTIVNDKSRDLLAFEKSGFRRLSGFAKIQGDFNELNDRLKCTFDRDASQTSDEFVDPNKSCLVVLDEMCDMGEQFKKANEGAVFTNSVHQIQTTVNDEPNQQSILTDSGKYIPNSPDTVKKRPCIPCELQPNTSIVSLKPNDDLVIVDQPKRDSQKITEVINSYSDDVTQATHYKMKNFQRSDTLIPITSGIVLSDPYTSSDVEFTLPRFSADGIEKASTELMSDGNSLHIMKEKTLTSEVIPWLAGIDGMASPPSYLNSSGPRSRMSPAITEHTESELDVSEQLDNVSISTDSMYADDEDDGSEMIFSKKYTEESGGECQVSYTFYNTAHDYDSDEFWAERSAADVNYKMLENSTNQASRTFKKARNEMQDIQRHLRDLRRQMEYLQDDVQTTVLTPAFSMGSSEWRPITD